MLESTKEGEPVQQNSVSDTRKHPIKRLIKHQKCPEWDFFGRTVNIYCFPLPRRSSFVCLRSMAVWRFECTLESAYLVWTFYWISCIHCRGGKTQDVFLRPRNKNKASQNVLFDATPVRVNTKLNYTARMMPHPISASSAEKPSTGDGISIWFPFSNSAAPSLIESVTKPHELVPVINWTLSLWHLMNSGPINSRQRKMTNTHRSDTGTEGRFQF